MAIQYKTLLYRDEPAIGRCFMQQRWRRSPSYPTLTVSDLGLVVGPRGYLKRTQNIQTGYLSVAAKSRTTFRKQDQVTVHFLVAEAFLGPKPSPKHEVNHLNSARSDNYRSNLEWVTRLENIRHAQNAGTFSNPPTRRGENHNMAKLTAEQVEEIRHLFSTTGLNNKEIGDRYGVNKTTIRHIRIGKNWVVSK